MSEKRLVRRYTAGEDLKEGDGVYISDDFTVKSAHDSGSPNKAVSAVGACDHRAKLGDQVYVVVFGPKKMKCDGSVGAGAPVQITDTSGHDGQIKQMAHLHFHSNPNTDSADGSGGSHTHSQGFTGGSLHPGRRLGIAEEAGSDEDWITVLIGK